MATILAHITVRPDCEERFEEIARTLYERTHSDESGIRHYEYWRGSTQRTYYTLLAFDDHRAFIAHQTSEHHESASPSLGAVMESVRLEWVDPIEGASALPPTATQETADDVDDLTADYSERFAADVAAWWLDLR